MGDIADGILSGQLPPSGEDMSKKRYYTITRGKKKVYLDEMSDSHLLNAIKYYTQKGHDPWQFRLEAMKRGI